MPVFVGRHVAGLDDLIPISSNPDPSKAGIHDVALGGGGLAATPTTGYGSLTAKNASLMAKNLVTTVKQSAKYLRA